MKTCYSSVMNVKNDRKSALKKLRNLMLSPKIEIDKFREKIENSFANPFVPNGVEVEERNYGNVNCTYLSPKVYFSSRVIFYIHGGSFCGGSAASYRSFCASLANAASCRVIVPEFRLPPAHPFPAALEDMEAVFKSYFIQEEVECKINGASPCSIVIMADGSGASIACGALQKCIDKERIGRVKQLVLFSPWLDFSEDTYVFKLKHQKDELITAEGIRRAVDMYTYQSNAGNPLVSPLKMKSEDIQSFPPVYIQCGEKEIFLEQAKDFSEKLEFNGVECTVEIVKNMMGMFQLADEFLNESHLAVEEVGKFITKREQFDIHELAQREHQLKINNIRQ